MKTVLPWLTLLLLGMILTACPRPVPVPHPPEDTDQCPAACERLRELGCEEGSPLEDGTTCEQFCIDTQESGHALNPTCVKSINSCEEIESCGVNVR